MKILLSGILLSLVSVSVLASELPSGQYRNSNGAYFAVKQGTNKVQWVGFNSNSGTLCNSTPISEATKYNYPGSSGSNSIDFDNVNGFKAYGTVDTQTGTVRINQVSGLNTLYKEDCANVGSNGNTGDYKNSSFSSSSKSKSKQ